MTRRELDHAMRRVLGRLAVTSNGTTTSWDSGGGGDADSRPPSSGDALPPHVRFANAYGPPFAPATGRFRQADDDAARERVLGDARGELEAVSRRTAPVVVGETLEQRNVRVLEDGTGWTVLDVANHFRIGHGEVIRLRLAAGREPANGTRTKPVTEDVIELRTRARSMRAARMSIGQIALLLGRSKSTIHAWVEG